MALAMKDVRDVYCVKCDRTGKLHDDCSRYTRELYQETEARAWSDRYVTNKAFYYEKQQERDAQLRALGIEPWGERRIDMNESKPYLDPYATLMRSREALLEKVDGLSEKIEVSCVEKIVVDSEQSELNGLVSQLEAVAIFTETVSTVVSPVIDSQPVICLDGVEAGDEFLSGVLDAPHCEDNCFDTPDFENCGDEGVADYSSANEDERYEDNGDLDGLGEVNSVGDCVQPCYEFPSAVLKMYDNVQIMYDLALSNLEIQRQKGDVEQIASCQEFVDYLSSHLPPARKASIVVESPVSCDDSKFLIEMGYYEHDSVLLRYIDLETKRHWIYVAHYNDTISVIDMLNVICHSRGKKHRYKCVIMENRDLGQLYDRADYKLEIDGACNDPTDEYFSDILVGMNEESFLQCPGFSTFAKKALFLPSIVYPDYCSVLYEVYPDAVFVIWDLQQFDVEGSGDFGDMCGFDLKESAKLAIHYLARILSDFPVLEEFDNFLTDEFYEQEMRRFWFATDPVLYCDFDDDGFIDYSDHCSWLNIGVRWVLSDQMRCHLGASR